MLRIKSTKSSIRVKRRGAFLRRRAMILSGIPWDTTIQRHHNIAKLLADSGYEVYFIEGIPSSRFTVKKLIERLCNKFRRRRDHVFVNRDNIIVIKRKFVNPMRGVYWMINKYQVKRLIKKTGEDFDVVINYLPVNTTYYFLKQLKTKFTIYDCVRDFENWGGYPNDINLIERELVLNSNLVLTDSYYLTNKIKNRHNALNVLQILPTVDEEQLNVLSNSKLKSKIINILYFGSVGSHIDIEILNSLAKDDYQIHIIGDILDGISLDSRIIRHGFISDKGLLAKRIIDCADAIIIPYKGNMDGVIPAKLMQCMATGLPIFINKFYDSVELGEYLYVYNNYSELINLIEEFNSIEHQKIAVEMFNLSKMNTTELKFLQLKTLLNIERNGKLRR
jgi:hypothetical protein